MGFWQYAAVVLGTRADPRARSLRGAQLAPSWPERPVRSAHGRLAARRPPSAQDCLRIDDPEEVESVVQAFARFVAGWAPCAATHGKESASKRTHSAKSTDARAPKPKREQKVALVAPMPNNAASSGEQQEQSSLLALETHDREGDERDNADRSPEVLAGASPRASHPRQCYGTRTGGHGRSLVHLNLCML